MIENWGVPLGSKTTENMIDTEKLAQILIYRRKTQKNWIKRF